MRRTSAVMLLVAASALGQGVDSARNGDFSRPDPANPSAPADWSIAPEGVWTRAPDEGPEGTACLKFVAVAGQFEPARMRCDYVTPDGICHVSTWILSEGTLRPVLRFMDLGHGRELARHTVEPRPGWQQVSVTARNPTADVGVELYADEQHLHGREAGGGEVRVARVRVTQVPADREGGVPDLGENMALGKPYTLEPAPNYALCKDPGDTTYLTDGQYTEGHFWTRKTTVGWSRRFVTIAIDLGEDQPVRGISFNAAAGVADVRWPNRILVMVSSDGKQWYEAGDLIGLHQQRSPLPEYGKYAVQRIWTDQFSTHGRFVTLCIEAAMSSYIFVDEIEIFRGEDKLLRQPRTGESFADPNARMEQRVIADLLCNQFRRALDAVDEDIAGLPATRQAALAGRAAALREAADEFLLPEMEGFRAILPVCDLEAEIFRLQARVWQAQGKPPLRVWNAQRWDMLNTFDEPQTPGLEPVEIHLMNNEWRGGVFNLTNARDHDVPVRLKVTGLPGGINPAYLRVHEVLTVGTRWFVPVSAAMPEARKEGDEFVITVPAGVTRQVWLSFRPQALPAGRHEGLVELSPAGLERATVALHLVVYPVRFPDETTLILGGWDYTNVESMYGVTPQNRAQLVAHLKEHYVNGPWATSRAMSGVRFDQQGQVEGTPDTSNFDDWVALWPEAKMYLVYLAVSDNMAGSKIGTPEFETKVANWARFWSDHVRSLGKSPGQVGLLIYDEPNNKEKFDLIVAWANAIKKGGPELVTWVDPQPRNDTDPVEMFRTVDVICPYRNPFLARDDWYREMYFEAQRHGAELWFYNADGPARTFDPFSFYLLQKWHAFQIGAKGSCFWAFGDNGRVSCWNEYPAKGNGPYCPSYIDETSVTTSKYMEAIREGVQDYEYLILLQARIEELEGKGMSAARLAAAKELLATAPARVLAGEKGSNYRWDESKDRAVQDRVRIEVLQALTELAKW